MNWKRQLKEGLLTKNPVLAQLLGMCSTMASWFITPIRWHI